MWRYISSDELYHHGIQGQRWGRRNGPPYPLDASDHSALEKKEGLKRVAASTARVIESREKNPNNRSKTIAKAAIIGGAAALALATPAGRRVLNAGGRALNAGGKALIGSGRAFGSVAQKATKATDKIVSGFSSFAAPIVKAEATAGKKAVETIMSTRAGKDMLIGGGIIAGAFTATALAANSIRTQKGKSFCDKLTDIEDRSNSFVNDKQARAEAVASARSIKQKVDSGRKYVTNQIKTYGNPVENVDTTEEKIRKKVRELEFASNFIPG